MSEIEGRFIGIVDETRGTIRIELYPLVHPDSFFVIDTSIFHLGAAHSDGESKAKARPRAPGR